MTNLRKHRILIVLKSLSKLCGYVFLRLFFQHFNCQAKLKPSQIVKLLWNSLALTVSYSLCCKRLNLLMKISGKEQESILYKNTNTVHTLKHVLSITHAHKHTSSKVQVGLSFFVLNIWQPACQTYLWGKEQWRIRQLQKVLFFKRKSLSLGKMLHVWNEHYDTSHLSTYLERNTFLCIKNMRSNNYLHKSGTVRYILVNCKIWLKD